MSDPATPSGVPISRVIDDAGDPLVAEISTSWHGRDGSHDHYREGTSLRAIEDKNGAWDLRVRRDAAPIYAHILSLEEYHCDDSGFGDGTSRSENFVYAVRIEAAEKDPQEEGKCLKSRAGIFSRRPWRPARSSRLLFPR